MIPIPLRSIPKLSSHLRLDLPKGLYPVAVPVKILKVLLSYSTLDTWPVTQSISGERHKLWSSSLWSLLHSPIASLLGPNTRLSIMFSNTPSLLSWLNILTMLHIHIYINLVYYCFMYFNFRMNTKKARTEICLEWIITWFSCFKSTLYFILNGFFLFFPKEPKYLKMFTFSYELLPMLIYSFAIMSR